MAYLVLEPQFAHSRNSLAGLLWPDLPNEAASANLRSVLANLHRVFANYLGPDISVLRVDYNEVQINREEIHCDVIDFEERVEQNDFKAAADLYQGRLLDGFASGSTPFDDWVQIKTEIFHQKGLYVLQTLSDELLDQGDLANSMAYARRVLELEPGLEEAHQQMIYLFALNGQRSAALLQFEQCKRLLTKELSVAPSAETLKLVDKIRTGSISQQGGVRGKLEETDRAAPEQANNGIVAREVELAWLENRLESAIQGQGKVLFITGDSGSGKTTLAKAFVARAFTLSDNIIALKGTCSIPGGVGSPYQPFREILLNLTRLEERFWNLDEYPQQFAGQLMEARRIVLRFLEQQYPDFNAMLLSPPVPLPSGTADGPDPFAVALQTGRLFDQFVQLFSRLSDHYPLLFVLDDLQWADEESLQLLSYLGRQLNGLAVLLVGIYRTEEVSAGRMNRRHPIETVVNELKRNYGEICLDLNNTDGRSFVGAYLNNFPNQLGQNFSETLYQHTGGHALFTVELIEQLKHSGGLVKNERGLWIEGEDLDWDKLPDRVESVAAERVNRLPPFWQTVLKTASVAGDRFIAEVLADVLKKDERIIVQGLSQVAARQHGLVVSSSTRVAGDRRLTLYRFRYHIFQQYLYKSLDAAELALLHGLVGDLLEALTADGGSEPVSLAANLAWHYEEAGNYKKAIHYNIMAGREANRLGAMNKAAGHFNHSLDLLEKIPADGEHINQKLSVLSELDLTYLALYGWGSQERGEIFERAYRLYGQQGDISKQLRCLGEIANNGLGRRDYEKTIERCQSLLQQSLKLGNPSFTMLAKKIMGECYSFSGKLTLGRRYLKEILPYLIECPQDPAFQYQGGDDRTSRIYLCYNLLISGYPDQSRRCLQENLALLEKVPQPFVRGFCLTLNGIDQSIILHDEEAVSNYAGQLYELTQQGEYTVFQPWVRFAEVWKHASASLDRDHLDALWAWVNTYLPHASTTGFLFSFCALAGLLIDAGNVAESQKIIDLILKSVEGLSTSSLWPLVLRLKGEHCQLSGKLDEAEKCFLQSIQVAQEQEAKLWELTAVTNLYKLKQQQGKEAVVLPMLSRVYAWFSEGLDTAPLKTARDLLEEYEAIPGPGVAR